jgi:formylglycine-generating enzyme required for sulfatase activity
MAHTPLTSVSSGRKMHTAFRGQEMKKCLLALFFPLAAVFGFAPAGQTHCGNGEKICTNSIGMEFVLIPAGSFQRESNVCGDFNETSHRPNVTVSKPFYLGKYEVTQEQWMAVMGSNPSEYKGRENPVENVSWDDAQEFIFRLNQKEGHARYRLPTEAEWEYAARGGTDAMYFFMEDPEKTDDGPEAKGSVDLNKAIADAIVVDKVVRDEIVARMADYAWTAEHVSSTHPVGKKKANPWGLHDVYGNVEEWVQDCYREKLPADREGTDYAGPEKGSKRVLRGGSWFDFAWKCRAASRYSLLPNSRRSTVGFRLALSPE